MPKSKPKRNPMRIKTPTQGHSHPKPISEKDQALASTRKRIEQYFEQKALDKDLDF